MKAPTSLSVKAVAERAGETDYQARIPKRGFRQQQKKLIKLRLDTHDMSAGPFWI